MERGTVTSFDLESDSGYIEADSDGKRIHFSVHSGRKVYRQVVGGRWCLTFAKQRRNRLPQLGARVCFIRRHGRYGNYAAPWDFMKETQVFAEKRRQVEQRKAEKREAKMSRVRHAEAA